MTTTIQKFAQYRVAECFDLVISPNHPQFEVFYGGETTPSERFWFSGETVNHPRGGLRLNEFYAYNSDNDAYFVAYYDVDGIFRTHDDLDEDNIDIIPAHIREALSA